MTAWILGKMAVRSLLSRRLLKQALEVRERLKSLRELEGTELDKVLFEMREIYDFRVIEEELGLALTKAGASPPPFARAYEVLGLRQRYLERVRSAPRWRERAETATMLGLLGDASAVRPLLEAMKDPEEDDEVKLACALRDPDSTVRLCAVEELGELDIGEVEDWIRSLLEDPVASVRTAARKLLIKPI